MSLRSKIALAVFLVASLFQGVGLIVHRATLGSRFEELDEAEARARVRRVRDNLQLELEGMSRAARDLQARLGDPADWVERDASEILAAVPRELGGKPADVVIAYDVAGWVHLRRVLEPLTGEPVRLRQLQNERFSPDHPLVQRLAAKKQAGGLLITERGALLLGTHEVEDPERYPVYLAVGRFLDLDALSALRAASGTQVEVRVIQPGQLSVGEERVLAQHAATQETVVEARDGEPLRAWSVVHDLQGDPALLLLVKTPPEVARLGAATWAYAISSALALAVMFTLVILLLLQWLVTGPLSYLTSHVVGIAHANESSARLDLKRADEIGQLADEFDSMLDKLARSRREVIRNARLAGRSEVSVGVIHNVGNVLSSVKVSADLARRALAELSSSDLRAISEELERHSDDLPGYLTSDEHGKHLVPYLAALVQAQESSAQSAGRELTALQEGIDHIVNLTLGLSSYESRVRVVEPLELSAQLNTVLELCLRSIDHDQPIEVERAFDASVYAVIDRHKLMEVLVNLVLNAVQAIQASGPSDGRLGLRLVREDADHARIEVTDSGIGIAAEDLQRIFNLGFTTREEGSGLGLHLAATTAAELGGRISAHSEGRGCGATFTLRLPLRPREVEQQEEPPSLVQALQSRASEIPA